MPVTIDGTTGIVAPSVTATPVIGGLVRGTAVASTSGTSIDFTGIPSWVRRITVMFSGVSTNGSSLIEIRLGTSSGVEATGYAGSTTSVGAGAASALLSTGFSIGNAHAATSVLNGSLVVTNNTGAVWTAAGVFGQSDGAGTRITAGTKTLSGTLDRVRITTVNGTDTFDAGTINIMYEG